MFDIFQIDVVEERGILSDCRPVLLTTSFEKIDLKYQGNSSWILLLWIHGIKLYSDSYQSNKNQVGINQKYTVYK